MECSGLNEVLPMNLGHLGTWSPVGGYLGRILRCGLAWGVCHGGWTFQYAPCIMFTLQGVSSLLFLSPRLFSVKDSYFLKT